MLTVRDPVSGLSITYNNARHAKYLTGGNIELLTSRGGTWVATIPSRMIVETVEPCVIENVLSDLTVDSAVKLLCCSVRNAKDSGAVARLKRALTKFNAHTWEWKR